MDTPDSRKIDGDKIVPRQSSGPVAREQRGNLLLVQIVSAFSDV